MFEFQINKLEKIMYLTCSEVHDACVFFHLHGRAAFLSEWPDITKKSQVAIADHFFVLYTKNIAVYDVR